MAYSKSHPFVSLGAVLYMTGFADGISASTFAFSAYVSENVQITRHGQAGTSVVAEICAVCARESLYSTNIHN